MGLIRHIVVSFAALAVCLGASVAQQRAEDTPTRPQFLEAMGLLSTQTVRIDSESLGREVALPFSLTVPSSDAVQVRVATEMSGVLAAVEFADSNNRFVESVVLATGTVEMSEEIDRAFAMANLLVLRSFPSLQETYPDARIAGFGPLELGELQAVQMVGTYTDPRLGAAVFRHVVLAPEGESDVVIALVALSVDRMPARNTAEIDNSFSGWMLRHLEFDPVE